MRRSLRQTLSAVRAQILTLSGIQQAGFFVQYGYAGSVPDRIPPYESVEAIFDDRLPTFESFVGEIANHLERFRAFGREAGDPVWGRGMFPPLDGAAAYTIVRRSGARRIVEIGSGNSTTYLARAARDCEVPPRITCIDPQPRRSLEGLGVTWERRVLCDRDAYLFDDMTPGDILFIDSSHIMMPGLDVDIQFNRIFPRLPSGTYVHLHDIFLPDDYPPRWRKRFYSEQNALMGWILSGYFEVCFPGHYMMTRHPEVIDTYLSAFQPLTTRQSGSIWLRRA